MQTQRLFVKLDTLLKLLLKQNDESIISLVNQILYSSYWLIFEYMQVLIFDMIIWNEIFLVIIQNEFCHTNANQRIIFCHLLMLFKCCMLLFPL